MGWNFGAQNADVSDMDGHGTHVAAIVAGSGVNSSLRLHLDQKNRFPENHGRGLQ